jgi:DNA-binding transcriptional LysR family regulator
VVDLADEGIDIAIRSGALTNQDLVARPLAPMRMLACASPAYLQRHKKPKHPRDLATLDCLRFSAWGLDPHWRFTKDDEEVKVPVRGSFVTNQPHALLAAGLAGMGVLVQSDAMLDPHLRSGALVRLLPKWELPTRPMHLVRRPEARPSAKVRSFTDFALERL